MSIDAYCLLVYNLSELLKDPLSLYLNANALICAYELSDTTKYAHTTCPSPPSLSPLCLSALSLTLTPILPTQILNEMKEIRKAVKKKRKELLREEIIRRDQWRAGTKVPYQILG